MPIAYMGRTMKRKMLLEALDAYAARWTCSAYAPFHAGMEQARVERFTRFVRGMPDCLERSCAVGHVTGAALVVSPDLDRVLLTHHRKLNMWLQLGGHADGEAEVHRVALREAREESGIEEAAFLSCGGLLDACGTPLPFDVDIHRIPAHGADPPHEHYDVRYLIGADDARPVVVSDESHDVRWLGVDEARGLTDEPSMHRMFDKLEMIRALRRSHERRI